MDTRDSRMWKNKFKQDDMDKLKNIYLNTQYSLWNSLITFNAIILSVISVLRILNTNMPKNLVLWLLITCSISIIFIIIIYYITKYFYYFLSLNTLSKKSPNEENEDNKCKQQKWVNPTFLYCIQNIIEIIIILIIFINLYKIFIWIKTFV